MFLRPSDRERSYILAVDDLVSIPVQLLQVSHTAEISARILNCYNEDFSLTVGVR